MRKIPFLLLLLLVGCTNSATDSATSSNGSQNEKEQKSQTDSVQSDQGNPSDVDLSTIVKNIRLECVFLGEDDYGVPRNHVYLRFGDKREKVGECLACEKIEGQSFSQYEIPEKAVSACGGWFAGGGDYFYAAVKGRTVEVYQGWQDEGQIEEADDSFHWKRIKEFPL